MALYGIPVISTTSDFYPFLSINTSRNYPNNSNVYNGAVCQPGPFNSRQAQVTGWLPDYCKVYFQGSQSLINASGRIYATVYY